MRKFAFKKLVRDKIIDDMLKNGQNPKYRVLNDDEFLTELKKKLLEEAEELPKASDGEIEGELADIQEIIDNLIKTLKIKRPRLKAAQKQKVVKRGSFKKKIYVDYVEVIDDVKWLNYYLANPHKYPEIKNR